MADEAEVKLRPDGALEKYVGELQKWRGIQRSRPEPVWCYLCGNAGKPFHPTATAGFYDDGRDGVTLRIKRRADENTTVLSLSEAGILRRWLNEMMG